LQNIVTEQKIVKRITGYLIVAPYQYVDAQKLTQSGFGKMRVCNLREKRRRMFIA